MLNGAGSKRAPAPRSFGQNTVSLVLAEIAGKVLSLLLWGFMARRLSVADFGAFSYLLTLLLIFGVVADLGLSQLAIRRMSNAPAAMGSQAATLLGVRLWVAVLITVSAAVLGRILTAPGDMMWAWLILTAGLLVDAFGAPYGALLRARQLITYEAGLRVASVSVQCAVSLAVLALGGGVVSLAAAFTATKALTVLGFALLNRRLSLWPSHIVVPDWKEARAWIAGALPYLGVALLGIVYFRINVLLLKHLVGFAPVGYYTAAFRIMEAALVIPWASAATLFPIVARRGDDPGADLMPVVHLSLRLLLGIAVPVAIVTLLMSEGILGIIYGPGYEESRGVMRILALALIPLYASAITSTVIAASSRPGVNTWIAVVMVVLHVGLGLWLIPGRGADGAAWATLTTESMGLLLGTVYIRRRLFNLNYLGFVIRPFVAAAAMALAIVLVRSVWLIPLYAAVYAGVLYLIGGVAAGERTLLKRLGAAITGAA